MLVRRTFRYRLYPTKAQATTMRHALELCRELYNAALQERRDAWRQGHIGVGFAQQSAQLPAIKTVRPDLRAVYSQTLQDVLRRADKAFAAFYARCQHGGKAGYPRFKPATRYQSFTYPQLGWRLEQGTLHLAKIGAVRVVQHRPLQGRVKTCQILRDGNHWYCAVTSEIAVPDPPPCEAPAVGIDVGLEYFAALSTGETVANPRYFRQSEKRLGKAQRRLAKIARSDPKRAEARQRVGAAHRRVRHQRQDFLHQLSHRLIATFGTVCVEDLNIRGLASSMLAKSVNDAAWGRLLFMLAYKAEGAGTRLIAVDPRGTSQTCPDCGLIAPKRLSDRWHSCPCGASMPRDVAAARVILARGLASMGAIPRRPSLQRGE
jgi:putative transposase